MQLISLRNGIKPLTIATGLLISSASPIYADIDQYSNIVSVITNHRTNKYIQETDNVEDAFIVSKRKFYSFYDSWKNKTFLLSSVIDIIEQS